MKVREPVRSPSAGYPHAPESTEVRAVGSLQGSNEPRCAGGKRRRTPKSSMSFPSGTVRSKVNPIAARKRASKLRRAREVVNARLLGSKNPLTANRKHRGSRTTLRSPPRRFTTPRGRSSSRQRSLRPRGTVVNERCQTGGVRSKPSAHQRLAPVLRGAPESVAGGQTFHIRSPKTPSVSSRTTSGFD